MTFSEEDIIDLFYPRKIALHDCSEYPSLIKTDNSKTVSKRTVVTTDSLIENVHFVLAWGTGSDVAYRLMHVNLSDLCAQLAIPNWCVLNLGLPKHITPRIKKFVKSFSKTLLKLCQKHKCPLIGGDSFRTGDAGPITLSLTMSGVTAHRISRQTHKQSGCVYVSGDFGKSLLGWQIFTNKKKLAPRLSMVCKNKFLRPMARTDLRDQLIRQVHAKNIDAIMDISDGIHCDLGRIAKLNKLDVTVELNAVPLDARLKKYLQPTDIIFSGEELELLILAEPGFNKIIPSALTEIGRYRRAKQDSLQYLLAGKPIHIKDKSFSHFK